MWKSNGDRVLIATCLASLIFASGCYVATSPAVFSKDTIAVSVWTDRGEVAFSHTGEKRPMELCIYAIDKDTLRRLPRKGLTTGAAVVSRTGWPIFFSSADHDGNGEFLKPWSSRLWRMKSLGDTPSELAATKYIVVPVGASPDSKSLLAYRHGERDDSVGYQILDGEGRWTDLPRDFGLPRWVDRRTLVGLRFPQPIAQFHRRVLPGPPGPELYRMIVAAYDVRSGHYRDICSVTMAAEQIGVFANDSCTFALLRSPTRLILPDQTQDGHPCLVSVDFIRGRKTLFYRSDKWPFMPVASPSGKWISIALADAPDPNVWFRSRLAILDRTGRPAKLPVLSRGPFGAFASDERLLFESLQGGQRLLMLGINEGRVTDLSDRIHRHFSVPATVR